MPIEEEGICLQRGRGLPREGKKEVCQWEGGRQISWNLKSRGYASWNAFLLLVRLMITVGKVNFTYSAYILRWAVLYTITSNNRKIGVNVLALVNKI